MPKGNMAPPQRHEVERARARRRNVSGSGLKKRGKQASAIENRWNASGKRKSGHVTLARLIAWQLSSRAALPKVAAGPRLKPYAMRRCYYRRRSNR